MRIAIAIAVILIIALAYMQVKPYYDKKKLVKQIMDKYTNPKSKDYTKAFEGTPEMLMKQDVETLKGILDGSIR